MRSVLPPDRSSEPLEDDAEDAVFEIPSADEAGEDEDRDDDEEAEEVAAPPRRRGRPARETDPRLRQMKEHKSTSDGQPAWWVGKDRAEFSRTVAEREEQLRKDPAAAKVKTPLNFNIG